MSHFKCLLARQRIYNKVLTGLLDRVCSNDRQSADYFTGTTSMSYDQWYVYTYWHYMYTFENPGYQYFFYITYVLLIISLVCIRY